MAGQKDNAWQVGTIIPTEGFPFLALDGNTNGWWSQGSCMHTNDVYGPWWAVDIGGYAKIGKIKIYQRKDTCCGMLFSYTYPIENIWHVFDDNRYTGSTSL